MVQKSTYILENFKILLLMLRNNCFSFNKTSSFWCILIMSYSGKIIFSLIWVFSVWPDSGGEQVVDVRVMSAGLRDKLIIISVSLIVTSSYVRSIRSMYATDAKVQ